jgi:alkylation response protein AidB-like acyl-CoA dehydrogenase
MHSSRACAIPARHEVTANAIVAGRKPPVPMRGASGMLSQRSSSGSVQHQTVSLRVFLLMEPSGIVGRMYKAPLQDLQFALDAVLGADVLAGCESFADYAPDFAEAILQEVGRFAEDVLDPLYASADRESAQWSPEGVRTPAGFKEAYSQFVADGWPTLRGRTEYGGQALPTLLVTAVEEILAGSNISFRLCPLLTQGAVEAITHCGSDAQKDLYLPRMVRGEWTGTMNLTEPQAGSDLALLRSRAIPNGDHYLLYGQKIFITYGEHDLAENIVHLVLARIDGAPPGVKGISLFIAPKFLPNADGSPGKRNDLRCTSIEHKLGIHGSPTCSMLYGEQGGAIGYLLGEAHHGLEYMFVMMNAARLGVGVEGYALAERAYQQALGWAQSRIQGKPPGPPSPAPLSIVHHYDVRRMLLTMKSQVEAMRYLALYAAAQLDIGKDHRDAAVRGAAGLRGDLLIPIVKGWSTETGFELCSLGIQVHGGMGFVEDTGAAQPLRDARIGTIYEGTTGIQASDLVGRKLFRDGGAVFGVLADEVAKSLEGLATGPATVQPIVSAASAALVQLRESAAAVLRLMSADAAQGGAVAVPFLRLAGLTLGGWLMARAAHAAAARLDEHAPEGQREFLAAKLQTARFYADQILPQTLALARIVQYGADSVTATDPSLF